MYRLKNNCESPRGLPAGGPIIEPGCSCLVHDDKVLTHPVVKNWLRSGALSLECGGQEKVPEGSGSDSTPPAAGGGPSGYPLSVLDASMPDVIAALPGLSDEDFDKVVRAEKDGKTRKGLVAEGAAFDQEWERRYGGAGSDS